MNLGKIARALRVTCGILVKEMTSILGPFLIRLIGGLTLVVAIIYGLFLWYDPQFFEKQDEGSIKLHSYAEKMERVIPALQASEPFEPKNKIPEDKFVIWYFGDQAEYFSRISVRPADKKQPGYEPHLGFGGVEHPSYRFEWNFPNMYLQKFYSDDFYWERAGFSGKLPWPDPRIVVLIKPVESGAGEKVYLKSNPGGTQQAGQITIKRFGYKVWLYDLNSKAVVGYRSFLPDPWPDKVSFQTPSKKRRQAAIKDQEGNLIATGDTNYIGSNQELFVWIRSIFEIRDGTPYFSDEEMIPK